MELTTTIRRQYESRLNQLAQSANTMSRARGQQKRQLEQQFNQQINQLLNRLQVDFPSRLVQNSVLTMLYQEASLRNDDVATALRTAWQQGIVQQQTRDVLAEQSRRWNVSGLLQEITRPKPDLNLLPCGSWFLQFDFKLARPYISHADVSSYIIDNPVSADRVFGFPLIRPTSWKGNLRSVLRQTKNWTDAQPELVRLFGNPKGAEDDFRAGRLECYPTFFYRVGLEIINPHNRAKKVGTKPILFECIPAGAQGVFSLLYVPFDLVGQASAIDEAGEHLRYLAPAIRELFLTYGFSAKRTSGFGVAEDKIIKGEVRTRAGEHDLTGKKLSHLAQEVKDVAF